MRTMPRNSPATRAKISLAARQRMSHGHRASEVPSTLDIAWAAGLYEGEGTCFKTKRRSIQVRIGMTDPDVLERCHRLFGGNLGLSNRAGTNGRKRDFWSWRLSGVRARGFMLTIFTLLGERRRTQFLRAMSEDEMPVRYGLAVS